MFPVLVVLFVANALIIGRISVFHLQSIRDRQVRGETRTPLLAFPPIGFSWDLWDKNNYSAEGQRLIPALVVVLSLWGLALLIAVASEIS